MWYSPHTIRKDPSSYEQREENDSYIIKPNLRRELSQLLQIQYDRRKYCDAGPAQNFTQLDYHLRAEVNHIASRRPPTAFGLVSASWTLELWSDTLPVRLRTFAGLLTVG